MCESRCWNEVVSLATRSFIPKIESVYLARIRLMCNDELSRSLWRDLPSSKSTNVSETEAGASRDVRDRK